MTMAIERKIDFSQVTGADPKDVECLYNLLVSKPDGIKLSDLFPLFNESREQYLEQTPFFTLLYWLNYEFKVLRFDELEQLYYIAQES